MVQLGTAGMDVARMNFSHGTHEAHTRNLKRLRQAGLRLGRPFGILQDLQGPKIRVGKLGDGVLLKPGKEVVFSTAPHPAEEEIPVTLPNLHKDIKRGDVLLLDDGLLECRVVRVQDRRIRAEVVHGGMLLSNKGLNLPGTKLSIPALSDKDRADALWGVKAGVDFMALSFVRSAADVRDLRRILDKTPAGRRIQVIGKIEKQEALDRFDEILAVLDGVMVARGDLGIETDATNVPVVQKQLIARCREAGVPVIVATQMLDSMQRNPRPTRAEVSDIATAVTDRADAVMLSGETASGKYPVESVRVMADTIRATEASAFDNLAQAVVEGARGVPELLGAAVRLVSDALSHAPVVILTSSGRTAREVASFRPEAPLHAITADPMVARQCRLLWGVTPWHVSLPKALQARTEKAMAFLRRQKALKPGMRAIVVSGAGKPGTANKMEIVRV
ncbi:MAG: pyruvate kinase [Candidatus Parcubacteria bacterium]